jgi:hypothetical protein
MVMQESVNTVEIEKVEALFAFSECGFHHSDQFLVRAIVVGIHYVVGAPGLEQIEDGSRSWNSTGRIDIALFGNVQQWKMAKRYSKEVKPTLKSITPACYDLRRIPRVSVFNQRRRHRAKPPDASEWRSTICSLEKT